MRCKYCKTCVKILANKAIQLLLPDKTVDAYVPRLVDKELERKLASASTVLIEGPRASGKTATANQIAKSAVYFDIDDSARQACMIDPTLVLDGETPRLFDEWQIVPNLWNHVRRASDDRRRKGNFILTASATPADDLTRHSGVGRMSRLRMRTMSLYELGFSSGEVSLKALIEGKRVSAPSATTTIREIVDFLCRGGWPGTLEENLTNAMTFVSDYIAEITRTDLEDQLGVRHDPTRLARLMRTLARNVSTEVSLTALASDISGASNGTQPRTVSSYLESLERLFVIEDLPPFSPHLRSRARRRKAPKRHFTDPSIAVAALRSNPAQLLRDLSYLGLLFKSLVIHELRVYGSLCDAALSHYRDNTGLEIDAVIQAASGGWIPVEVKLGNEESTIDEAARSLHKFVDKVDLDRMGSPSNLLILTHTGFAYQRKDGVTVAPIVSLGP